MGNWIYINGEFLPVEEAKVSVFDHGLLYGDGVFEGLRTYNGRIFRLEEHIERLYRSAHFIMLRIPLSKEEMKETILEAVRRNNLKDAYIRVVVTRGVGDLGLDPDKCLRPNLIIIVDKITLYPEKLYEEGLEVVTVPTIRNPITALNPQVKSLNYLNNILAKIEGKNSGCIEAIMLNQEGFVLEATGDNIFIVDRGTLITPPTHIGILEGITRQVVIEIARDLGIPFKEEVFSRYQLFNAQECFLTGTAAEIIPVVKVDRRRIGDGKPGAITKRIRKAFREITMREGEPVYTDEV